MATPVSDAVALLTSVNNNNGTLNDEFISGLVQGGSWSFVEPSSRILTYSLNINDNGDLVNPTPGPGGTWEASPAMAAAVAQALTAWSNVADIDFQQVASGTYYFQSTADLAFTLTGDDLLNGLSAIGLSFFPDPAYVDELFAVPDDDIDRTVYPNAEGDVFLDNYYEAFDLLDPGGTGLTVILHEIGHALGLKHPDDDGGNGRPLFSSLGISNYDLMRYTVMSADIVMHGNSASGFAATPMPLDILAIQHIYGANMTYHAGDDVYVLANDGVMKTIWDAGGTDTFDASGYAQGVTMELRPGTGYAQGVSADVSFTAIAFNVTIESAIGSAFNDSLAGNDAANTLAGGGGNDTLIGRENNDVLNAGAGDDVGFGDAGDDNVLGGPGADNLQGNAGNDTLTGNAGNDTLTGGADNDVMFGRDDNDVMFGRADNDNVLGGLGADNIQGNAGNDTLTGGDGTGLDTLDAGDKLDGGPGNDSLFGGYGADSLFGGYDDDSLFGGPGNDSLFGGYGDDSLIGGSGNDSLSGDYGNDTLYGGADVDSLHGGEGNDTLDGGDSYDVVLGGPGDDSLFGGYGFDSLLGGPGNDTLTGGDDNDTLVGGDGTGTDTLDGSDTLDGGAGNDFLSGGFGADHALGGDGHDTLIGNAGNDMLSGGAGNDVMSGRAGNDTVHGGEGNDTMVGNADTDLFRYDASIFGSDDVVANGADFVSGTAAGDLISMLGLIEELEIGNFALSALTANTVVGGALVAGVTNVAYTGGALQLDLDGNGTFSAATDFQIALTGVATVTYNVTDDLFHLS